MIQVTALAIPAADGRYSVCVPELPDVVTEADSIEDVPAMVAECAEGILSLYHRDNRERVLGELTDPLAGEVDS